MGHGPHVSTKWRHFPIAEPQLHSLPFHSPHSLSRMKKKRKERMNWSEKVKKKKMEKRMKSTNDSRISTRSRP
jgi:hypothetical protein